MMKNICKWWHNVHLIDGNFDNILLDILVPEISTIWIPVHVIGHSNLWAKHLAAVAAVILGSLASLHVSLNILFPARLVNAQTALERFLFRVGSLVSLELVVISALHPTGTARQWFSDLIVPISMQTLHVPRQVCPQGKCLSAVRTLINCSVWARHSLQNVTISFCRI